MPALVSVRFAPLVALLDEPGEGVPLRPVVSGRPADSLGSAEGLLAGPWL
jgi:hypothetical protein